MRPLLSMHVDRPWGSFDEFIANTPCTVKIITVNPGESLSLQYHEHRSEFWVVLKGNGYVTIGDNRKEASAGDRFDIGVHTNHRAEGGTEALVFLEISTGEFDENDIVRIDDKYGRVSS
ncbi:MAG: phosphomannose isomerase type II C-terminal cupin domain [Candidatus Zambryskibacteria bacterium]|nr:phosphomannose isomerase type II C-terminal cupin domain [Candidatus Zambryskibacteria bacterium]